MGIPARRAMTLAMFGASDCCPTQPTITSSIWAPFRLLRLRSSRNATSPNAWSVSVFNAPPKVPCGVRTPFTMTGSAAMGPPTDRRLSSVDSALLRLREPPQLLHVLEGHFLSSADEFLRIEEFQPVRSRNRGPQGEVRLTARHFGDLILHGLHGSHDDVKHERRYGAEQLLA